MPSQNVYLLEYTVSPKNNQFKLTTGTYARMGRAFTWKYDLELENNLKSLLYSSMQECDKPWSTFDKVKKEVVSLFGFNEDICNTIEETKCTRKIDFLVLCSKDEESKFYVQLQTNSNTFVVRYHGYLVPPNKSVEEPQDLLQLFK